MKLSIVVVNFNSGDRLARALDALEAMPGRFEVVVVDNRSTDGSASWNGHRKARLLSMEENAGFARAANAGIEASSGELVLILNPDMVLTQESIDRLVGRMRSDPRIGALGPRIRDGANGDGGGGGQSGLLPFPSNGGLLREALFFDRLFPVRTAGNGANGGHLEGGNGTEESNGVGAGWLQGCCLLLRREALEEVGAFDEKFFLYYEDVDLLWRMQEGPWRAAVEPGCEVIHDAGARDARYGEAKIRHYHENLLEFYRKHYPEERLPGLRRILIIRSLIRLGVWASLYLVAPRRRATRGERVRGYASVLKVLWEGGGNGTDGDGGRP